jgi:trimethylamine:corrinoid methyltransferase-like protein
MLSIVPPYKALGGATIPIVLAKGALWQDKAKALNGLLAAE